MSEHLLVLKCAAAGRYVIQATDFPVARVFDTSSSTLVATLELPRRQRSSLSTVTLTAVGIGLCSFELIHTIESAPQVIKDGKMESANSSIDESDVEVLQTCYAAAGLSNGTLLLHDVTRNKLLFFVALSPMQRAVQAISFCGAFVFALCNDGKVYGLNVCAYERGVCAMIDVGKDVHAIASTIVDTFLSSSPLTSSSKTSDATKSTSIRIIASGTSITLYECNLSEHNMRTHSSINNKSVNHTVAIDRSHVNNTLQFHKIVNFAAHGAPANYAWVSAAAVNYTSTSHHLLSHALSSLVHNTTALHQHGNADKFTSHPTQPIAALTANAEEGVLRIWDVQPSQSQTLRCRRTLLCGQRIAHVQVLECQQNIHQREIEINESTSTTLTASTEKYNEMDDMKQKGVVLGLVIATTFTGSVLIWDFTNKTGLLPSVVEPLPISPTLVFTCSTPAGRLLFAAASIIANVMRGNPSKTTTTYNKNKFEDNVNTLDVNEGAKFSLQSVSLLFLRGRFALPHFDVYKVDELLQYNKYHRLSATTRLQSDEVNAQNVSKSRETQQQQKITTTTITSQKKKMQEKQEIVVARRLAMLGFGAEVQVIDVPTSDVAWPFGSSSKSSTRNLHSPHQINNAATNHNNHNYNNYSGEANVSLLSSDATFHVMDNVWATYRTKLATRAMYAASESFPLAHSIHASSIRDLPTGEETLEQRLRAFERVASNATTTQAILSRKQLASISISQKINYKSSITTSNKNNESILNKEADNVSNTYQHETQSRSVTHINGELPNDLDNDDDNVANTDNVIQKYSGALGLATIPLYQALHANDAAATMELLSISSRDVDEMRATVMSLQLPYCLQLIRVLSERLGICTGKMAFSINQIHDNDDDDDDNDDGKNKDYSSENNSDGSNHKLTLNTSAKDASFITHDRLSQGVSVLDNTNTTNSNNINSESKRANAKMVTVGGGSAAIAVHAPMLRWFNVILQCRGMELYELQRQMSASDAMNNQIISPPKDFIAPLLQQYRSMCALHDKLAMLHGRLSIFNAVRPQERENFFNAPGNMSTSNLESGYMLHARQNKGSMTKSKAKRGTGMSKRVIGTLRDDVLFPRMFTEVRNRTNGPYVVRVRSRLASREKKKQMQLKNVSFVRERAKQLALRKLSKTHDEAIDDNLIDGDDIGDSHDMENVDGNDVDLDALESMNLNESDVEEDGHGSDEGEEKLNDDNDNELLEDDINGHSPRIAKTNNSRGAKVVRVAANEMIPNIEDNLADEVVQGKTSTVHTKGKTTSGNFMNEYAGEFETDHAMNEAEFSSESDDEVNSEIEDINSDESSSDNEDEDDEDNESNDSKSNGDEDALHDNDNDQNSSSDDDDSSEDENEMSGIGEDMQNLLSTYDTAEDEVEKRKTKRVRTD